MTARKHFVYDIKTQWNCDLAYIVGLIASDGWLGKTTAEVGFVSKDIELINNYRNILNINKSDFRSGRGGSRRKDYRTIRFKSRKFY